MRKFAIIAGVLFTALIFAVDTDNVSAQQQNKNHKKTNIVVVKRGDTLEKIAKKNNTTYSRLFDANKKIKHPDLIYAGDKVRIPSPNEKLAKRSLNTQQSKSKTSYSTNNIRYKKVTSTVGSNVAGGVWDRLAACESGGNWSINTGNGYYGGLQFTLSTWRGVGGSGYPHQASKAEQIKRAQILQSSSGWGQWPACSAKLGLI